MERLRIAVVVLLLLSLLANGFMLLDIKRQQSTYDNTVADLTSANDELKREIQANGKELASTQSALLQSSKAVQESISEIQRLNTLLAKVKTEVVTVYEQVEVPLVKDSLVHDTVYVDNTSRFDYRSRWLDMTGRMEHQMLIFDSVVVRNSYTVEVGFERKWFLAKPEPKVYLQNDNPHSATESLNSVILESPKKWYDSKLLWLGAGIIAVIAIKQR